MLALIAAAAVIKVFILVASVVLAFAAALLAALPQAAFSRRIALVFAEILPEIWISVLLIEIFVAARAAIARLFVIKSPSFLFVAAKGGSCAASAVPRTPPRPATFLVISLRPVRFARTADADPLYATADLNSSLSQNLNFFLIFLLLK